MSTTTARGVLAARGFILDVPLIGEAEAAARVLALWRDGAALRRLDHGPWLLVLPEPVDVRADLAPGAPLVECGDGLVAAGVGEPDAAGARSGEAVLLRGGVVQRYTWAALPAVDPAGWLDVAGLTVRRIPVAERSVDALVEAVPEQPVPDLRAAARVRPRSDRARRLLAGGPARTAARRWPGRLLAGLWAVGSVLLGAAAVVVVAIGAMTVSHLDARLVIGALVGAAIGLRYVTPGAGRSTGSTPGAAAPVAGRPSARKGRRLDRLTGWFRRRTAVGTATRTAGTTGGRGRPRVSPLHRIGGLLSRLALAGPAGPVLRRRHARYLDELTTAFAQRRWEDALRDAIAVGSDPASQDGWLSLALPRRRTRDLRPSTETASAGPLLPYGASAAGHLSGVYRAASEALEHEGRIDEAAFVLADLLACPPEAVALLARHGRLRQAAELAEGRALPPELTVRLWWRAGERERALQIARTRKVFATAIERLKQDDPAAARELRIAWVVSCQQSGDHLGAVEAAWPEEELRPLVVTDLHAAVALGGRPQARALVRLLALGAGPATRDLALAAGPATRDLALALLDGDEPHHASGRAELIATLAETPAADPAVDRQLATAAARALVRAPADTRQSEAHTLRRHSSALLRRADPLAAADLRTPATRSRPAPDGPLLLTADDRPGGLPVRDAAVLDSGSVLVACGQAGVRLLGRDGRVRTRWDVPADRIVLADHGSVALVAAQYGEIWEVTRLDLATRAARRWATVRARGLARSFDGRTLITTDADGITVLDTLAARPTVVWHELRGESELLSPVVRSADGCSAIVATGTLVERWKWDLPGWELRSRHRLDPDAGPPEGLLAGGRLLALRPEPDGGTRLRVHGAGPDGAGLLLPKATGLSVLTDGDQYAAVVGQSDGSVRVELAGIGAERMTVIIPGTSPGRIGLRRHGRTVTVWDSAGRIVAAATTPATALANLRTPA